jgi:hypothetical protein
MSRRKKVLAPRTPGGATGLLKRVRMRLVLLWPHQGLTAMERAAISDAIMLVDLCISRVNSTLET